MRRVLILGGTPEAVELARQLRDRPDFEITTSFAGRTRRPRLPPGRVRIGGFGAAEGLARYLRERTIDLLVDASHPFAVRIAENAARAAAATRTPFLVLARQMMPRPDGASEVPDLESALQAAREHGRRILITFRVERLPPGADPRLEVIVRAIEPPEQPPPDRVRWLLARGPFGMEDERRLLDRLGIEVVIAKASDGPGTSAKLAAARSLGRTIVLIPRPIRPGAGVVVESVADAVRWLDHQALGRRT